MHRTRNKLLIPLFLGLATAIPQRAFADARLENLSRILNERKESLRDLQSEYNRLNAEVESQQASEAIPAVCQGRLSGTSGVAIMSANDGNIRNLRFTPYLGNKVALYYSGKWKLYTFSELTFDLNTLALTHGVNKNIDFFLYKSDAGVLTLEPSAEWTSDTARADALALQDGVWVKASDPRRRYIGTVRADETALNRRVDDIASSRGIYNACNRVYRTIWAMEAVDSWSYLGTTFRAANNDAVSTLVSFLVGLNEEPIQLMVKTNVISTSTTLFNATMGIGIDGTTTNSAFLFGGAASPSDTAAALQIARAIQFVGVGWHTANWVEKCSGCGVTNITIYGDNAVPARSRSGIAGWVKQ